MSFWITISLAALIAAALLGLVLLRRRAGAEPAAAYDLRIYRDQLGEVDRDLARGVIGEADAERARTEISRRILTADAQMQREARTGVGTTQVTAMAAVLLCAVTIAGSLLLYRTLGAPGYGDLPQERRIEMAEERRQTRPSQAEAEARVPERPAPDVDEAYAELLTQLREAASNRPNDLQGQELLARHEANTGNFAAAARAQGEIIRIKGDKADATDFAEHAELLILAAGGYVSPEAEASLRRALELEPRHGAARYYWGLFLGQIGRPDQGFRVWDDLLRTSPPDAGWVPAIRAQIPEMAWRAGVDYTLPEPAAAMPGLPGPSAEDVEAAGDMTPQERQEMIRGMVDRLMDRLANQGGTPDEWARLIGALGVLGDTDRAQAIYDEAMQKFGANAAAAESLRAAARQAGLDAETAPDTGLRPPTTEELRGPSREDMDAASDMTPDERQEMIRGMVDRLEERLGAEGGSAQEWARLIQALGVLGARERAQAAYEAARTAFADSDPDLSVIDASARRAGLTE